MVDARVLYIVMTVVFFGLVTWVIAVFASPAYRRPVRAPAERETLGRPGADPSEAGPAGSPAPPREGPRREP